jgi:hypothetical protein
MLEAIGSVAGCQRSAEKNLPLAGTGLFSHGQLLT